MADPLSAAGGAVERAAIAHAAVARAAAAGGPFTIAATPVDQGTPDPLQKARQVTPDNAIVLSFQVLQAQRIDELQYVLLDLWRQKDPQLGGHQRVMEATALNALLDSTLHSYGIPIRNLKGVGTVLTRI